ncbi:Uncharacterized membrane protein [Prosthecobacter debontii]|uniref:Uncharacterized membrane protein n=1 Tax=Prosthecobacter debontii TaxID=48467 RepID=A0A1T4XAQ8_9BACT|nr:autotransporter domain-containing protein [Prosthecobacter debontii]SKA86670.1 Uncharacterized membrane protein [Prosthecobacter debontii]
MKHYLPAILCAAVIGGALGVPLPGHAQTTQPPIVGFLFDAQAISGNGQVVLGQEKGGSLLWTWSEGTNWLEVDTPLEEAYLYANGLSKTGRFIVGDVYDYDNSIGLGFWMDSTTGEAVLLQATGAYWTGATDVNDAGDTVVGYADFNGVDSGPWFSQALWWHGDFEDPTVLMPLDEELSSARALAVDGAGERAVGYAFDNGIVSTQQAVYWELTGDEPTAVAIGDVGEGGYSVANDISRNGKYIVGSVRTEDGMRGFTFTDEGGMIEIPLISDAIFYNGTANAVSNNGFVVGSNAPERDDTSAPATDTAYIYDEVHGTRSLRTWLQDSGVEVGEWNFASATGISEDGKVVVGNTGLRYRGPSASDADPEEYVGFIARVGSGAIIPEDFVSTLGAGQAPTGAAFNLLNLTMHGAHHIPLQMMGANRHAWMTGDFARYDDSDVNSGLAEVGGAVDFFNQQLVAGLGIGQSWIAQDLAQNGDVDMDGTYVLGELSFKPTKLPVVFTITGAIGNWEADIDRHYTNAGLEDSSEGSTDVLSSTLRFRVDWLDIVKVGGFGITPKIEYTVNHTNADAYTESGGGFPVSYDEQSHTAQEVRYGLTAARQLLQNKALLRLRVEGVHRFDQTGPSTGGQVIGLFDFNLPGQQIQQDWALFGIDFAYAINEKVTLNTSVSTSTSGEDPVFGGSVGIQVKF